MVVQLVTITLFFLPLIFAASRLRMGLNFGFQKVKSILQLGLLLQWLLAIPLYVMSESLIGYPISFSFSEGTWILLQTAMTSSTLFFLILAFQYTPLLLLFHLIIWVVKNLEMRF